MQAQDVELYEAYTKATDLGVGLGYNFLFGGAPSVSSLA